MNKSKTIIFVLDSFHLYNGYDKDKYVECYSYFDTEEAINHNDNHIITYDIGHLSFDLETLGYIILIGYKGVCKRFYVGMSTANGKELRFAHNLRRLLIGGALDNDLGIERNKFYYDMNKSTAELLADQLTKEKFDILGKITSKTIGLELGQGIKAMTPEESKEWHKKHSYRDKDGHLVITPNKLTEEQKKKLEDISSLPEYYKGKHQYNPTPEDFEIIKKLLNGFKENDGCSYYTNDFGQIFVKTCQASWNALAGREWLIDKDKMTCKLIAMN